MKTLILVLILFMPMAGVAQGRRTSQTEMGIFYSSVGILWIATGLDIHSGKRLNPNRYQEINLLGGSAGQVMTSAGATIVGIIIRRHGGRFRWIGTALVAGAAGGHCYGAAHNYRLR